LIHGKITGDVQAGISVKIYKPYCGSGEVLVDSVTTNSEGVYWFGCLANGTYTVVPDPDMDMEFYNFLPEFEEFTIPNTQFSQINDFTADETCVSKYGDGVRFIDNNDGTVLDNCTGLVWLKDTSTEFCIGGEEDYDTVSGFVALIHNGRCGLTDGSTPGEWRLPSAQEWMQVGTDPPDICELPPYNYEDISECYVPDWRIIDRPFPARKGYYTNDGWNFVARTYQDGTGVNIITWEEDDQWPSSCSDHYSYGVGQCDFYMWAVRDNITIESCISNKDTCVYEAQVTHNTCLFVAGQGIGSVEACDAQFSSNLNDCTTVYNECAARVL
jgi:hypothetical protein